MKRLWQIDVSPSMDALHFEVEADTEDEACALVDARLAESDPFADATWWVHDAGPVEVAT